MAEIKSRPGKMQEQQYAFYAIHEKLTIASKKTEVPGLFNPGNK